MNILLNTLQGRANGVRWFPNTKQRRVRVQILAAAALLQLVSPVRGIASGTSPPTVQPWRVAALKVTKNTW
jgi:hypothetical protein